LSVMAKSESIEEAVIDASPVVVYKAILNEYAGVTNWWMPNMQFKLRGELPIDHEGAIVDVTALPKSRTSSSKASYKMTKIVEGKSIEYEETGAFVGTGKWTFEPTDGKTKVQFQLNARINSRLISFASHFINLDKMHTDMMQKGFKALNSYLSKK
jgi:hypothetical protein